jgi:hypothetical protein
LSTRRNKRIQGTIKQFEEEHDGDFMRMRIAAICEAQEAMERGVAERDDPSRFLA